MFTHARTLIDVCEQCTSLYVCGVPNIFRAPTYTIVYAWLWWYRNRCLLRHMPPCALFGVSAVSTLLCDGSWCCGAFFACCPGHLFLSICACFFKAIYGWWWLCEILATFHFRFPDSCSLYPPACVPTICSRVHTCAGIPCMLSSTCYD